MNRKHLKMLARKYARMAKLHREMRNFKCASIYYGRLLGVCAVLATFGTMTEAKWFWKFAVETGAALTY